VFRKSPSADRSSVLPELILSSFSRSVQQVNKQRQKKIRNKEKTKIKNTEGKREQLFFSFFCAPGSIFFFTFRFF